MPSISVIIPVLNESRTILRCLKQFHGVPDTEVVVVDGGSTDGTQDLVADTGLTALVRSDIPGRAFQMNEGARESKGEILLFLHADTELPEGGLEMISSALEDPAVAGGRFRLRLDEEGWQFQLISKASTWRSSLLGITYGDQGIFCRRSVFRKVNGFPNLQIFEDSEFCHMLEREGRFVLLTGSVCSSARRWRRSGIWATIVWMWLLRALFKLSVSDRRLRKWYHNTR
jgi:rSAM/selenodomain-associated transferase 2